MKNLELEKFGLIEIEKEEHVKLNGGFLGIVLGSIIVAGFLWGVANFVKDVLIEGEDFNMNEW